MAGDSQKTARKPPEISPYLLTWILAGLGLWCLYDGFLSTDPGMQSYAWFNRIAGVLLSAAAVVDFRRMRKKLSRLSRKTS